MIQYCICLRRGARGLVGGDRDRGRGWLVGQAGLAVLDKDLHEDLFVGGLEDVGAVWQVALGRQVDFERDNVWAGHMWFSLSCSGMRLLYVMGAAFYLYSY